MPRCRLLKSCPIHHVYLPRIFAHLISSSLSGESHLPSDVCILFSRLMIHTQSLLLLLLLILSPASISHIFPSVFACLLRSTLPAPASSKLTFDSLLFFFSTKSAPIPSPGASSVSTSSKNHPLGFILTKVSLIWVFILSNLFLKHHCGSFTGTTIFQSWLETAARNISFDPVKIPFTKSQCSLL